MAIKKEFQERIFESNIKATEEEISNILKLVAPGTHFRSALDGALKTNRGALIVVEKITIQDILDGGFRINTKFTPQKLIELTKMDGAIILSEDMKKITHANVTLTPDHKIKTEETGTRHKAAERTAKQIGTLTIAISERKHEINLFYKNIKHPMISTEELFRKANENIQLLEKQRELFDRNIERLNILELSNSTSLHQAIKSIQKGRLIQKISENLKKYIIELGKEGTLLKIRLKEITLGVNKETELIIKDYTRFNVKRSKHLLENLNYEEILKNPHILEILGHNDYSSHKTIKGWRILHKTSLHDSEIALITTETETLDKALQESQKFYEEIFDEEKAQSISKELKKIKLIT